MRQEKRPGRYRKIGIPLELLEEAFVGTSHWNKSLPISRRISNIGSATLNISPFRVKRGSRLALFRFASAPSSFDSLASSSRLLYPLLEKPSARR